MRTGAARLRAAVAAGRAGNSATPAGETVWLQRHRHSLASSYVTVAETRLCLWSQIQQLEDHLEKSKEELNQLKSDLQENVELVSFLLTGL